MSHLVSYKWIRKTQVIPEYVVFYKNVGILLGGLSDCEGLVGGYSQEMIMNSIQFHSNLFNIVISLIFITT